MQLASCLEGGHGSGKLGVGGVRQGEAAIRNLLSLSGRNHAKGQGVAGKTKMRPDKLDCGPARNTPIDNKANLVNWMSGLRSLACGTNYNQTMGQWAQFKKKISIFQVDKYVHHKDMRSQDARCVNDYKKATKIKDIRLQSSRG